MTDVEIGGPLGLHALHPPVSDAAVLSSPPRLNALSHFDDHSSQGSSLSRHSQAATLKHSASDVAAFTTTAQPTHDLTPPSSNASIACEDDQALSAKQGGSTANHPIVQLAKDEAALRQNSHSPHSSSSHEGVAGSKRTATGEVKPVQTAGYEYPTTADRPDLGQVRTTEAVSNESSNVTEISSQLRTKLKYAMLKVQNGWQTRSLDELESIASASPRSTVSGFQHVQDQAAFTSPQSRTKPRLHREWSDSSSSESTRSDVQTRMPNAPTIPAKGHLRDTYNSQRSLGPPADIRPSTRRRPTPNDGLKLSGMTASPMFHGRSPAVRPSPSQRTPSQNAAMEADAVETLLFMASPNNSAYHPPSQASQESSLRSTLIAQTSPLRAQFSQASVTSPKKVAFSDDRDSGHFRTREAQINHELDTLPDDSDEELERVPLPAG